jgi:uncharacterized protein (TIGR02145 family)
LDSTNHFLLNLYLIMKTIALYSLCIIALLFQSCGDSTAPIIEPDLLDSRNNRTYKTVKIGSQVWMAENLDVATFSNGDIIPEARTVEEWLDAELKREPVWCYYMNDLHNTAKYGKLYNGYAAIDPRGIAPEGWHVPSDGEWSVLSTFLGGDSIAGGKMKSTSEWYSPNVNATNSSGFNAKGFGHRDKSGLFVGYGIETQFWSSTRSDGTGDNFFGRWLNTLNNELGGGGRDGRRGLYIRCVKN